MKKTLKKRLLTLSVAALALTLGMARGAAAQGLASAVLSASAPDSVAENAGTVTVTITVNGLAGNLNRRLKVSTDANQHTATPGSDYVAVPLTTVPFTDHVNGTFTHSLTVTINDDTAFESAEETFEVDAKLERETYRGSGSYVQEGTSVTEVIGITDDETRAAVGWSVDNAASVTEGNTVEIAARITSPTGDCPVAFDVKVAFATADTSETDHDSLSANTDRVTIPACAHESDELEVSVYQDSDKNENEQLSVTMSLPSGTDDRIELPSTTTKTWNIVDP